MTEIVGGLIVALLTGLAWLAYKHPREFPVIGKTLMATSMAAFLLTAAYNFGLTNGGHAVMLAAKDGDVETMLAALRKVSPPMGTITLSLMAFLLYVGFLGAMPHFLKLGNDRDVNDKRD